MLLKFLGHRYPSLAEPEISLLHPQAMNARIKTLAATPLTTPIANPILDADSLRRSALTVIGTEARAMRSRRASTKTSCAHAS